MTSLGVAPTGATRVNYVIPMIVLTSRWASELGSISSLPQTTAVVLIPVIETGIKQSYCFVGSSISGKFQKQECQLLRRQELMNHGILNGNDPHLQEFPFFGSCAETLLFNMATVLETRM